MKKQIEAIAKNHGFEAIVTCSRPEFSVVSYDVRLHNGKKSLNWDGGYFIGEVGTANSKDSVLEQFEKFIATHK
jgi:hypothetical protein